jgi:hypothetical protein
VKNGILSANELARLLADELCLPLIDLSLFRPHPDALSSLEMTFCRRNYLLPVRLSKTWLQIVMANPLDVELIENIQAKVEHNLSIAVAPIDAITETIKLFYQSASEPSSLPAKPAEPKDQPVMQRYRDAGAQTIEKIDSYPHSILELLGEIHRLRGWF